MVEIILANRDRKTRLFFRTWTVCKVILLLGKHIQAFKIEGIVITLEWVDMRSGVPVGDMKKMP